MTSGKANQKVVTDRLDFVIRMIGDIRSLPLGSLEEFMQDRRNIGAAESCLRRALEGLLDLGRHLLAKVFGLGVTEYKKVADELEQNKVLTREAARRLRLLAGYRNRLVHFYHEVSAEELYQICSGELEDLVNVRDALIAWVKANPQCIDTTI
jgi:uncharacterized protein YutE (UPF0331/DUF86 family)